MEVREKFLIFPHPLNVNSNININSYVKDIKNHTTTLAIYINTWYNNRWSEPKKVRFLGSSPSPEDITMNVSKVKSLTIVFALLLLVGMITVGCGKQKPKNAWVNTNTLPGHTFAQNAQKSQSSGVVYLGSDNKSSYNGFGPRDPSFEFKDLR